MYSLEGRAERRGNSKSLCIHIPAHFHRVAGLAGVHIFILGGLHQEGVLPLGGAHALDPLLVGFHEDVLARVHVLPHLDVESVLGALRAKRHKKRANQKYKVRIFCGMGQYECEYLCVVCVCSRI